MAAGLQAWSVFGTYSLRGVTSSISQMRAVDSAARRSAGGMAGMGASGAVGAMGVSTLVLAAGAAVGIIGVESVRAFSEFDAALTQSLAIMGDVSTAMRRDMEDAARSVALTTSFSANDAAESFFFLASAGMDAEQSIQALPIVANFAQAGMFDLARATDILTDAQSALGMTIRDDAVANMEQMERVSNALVAANTLANASVSEFGLALINRAAPRMRQFNIDVEEGVAVLAAFADQGIKGRAAGMQLNILLRDLTRGAVSNSEAFDTLGISVFDAENNIRSIADILEDFERLLVNASDAQRTMAFEALQLNQRVADALSTLLGTSEQIREYEHGIRSAGNISQDVAERQLQTLRQQLGLLGSSIKDIFLEVGRNLNPAVEQLTNLLLDNVNIVRNVVLFTFSALAGVIKAVSDQISIFVEGIQNVWNWIPKVTRETLPFINILESLIQSYETHNALMEANDSRMRANALELRFARQTISEADSDLSSLVSTFESLGHVSERDIITAATAIRRFGDETLTPIDRLRMMAQLPTEIQTRFSDASDGIIRALFAIRHSLTETIETASGSELEAMFENLDDVLARISSTQQDQVSAIDQATEALGDWVSLADVSRDLNRDTLSSLRQMLTPLSQIKELVRDPNISLKERIQLYRSELQSINAIRREINLQKDDFNIAGDTFGDGLLEVPAPAVERTVRDMRGLIEKKSKPIFSDLRNDFEREGAALMVSLARGSLSAGDLLSAAMRIIAQNFIMPGLLDALGIFSPSRWMMARGRDIVVGLAMGIEGNASLVGNAMQSVVNPIQDAVSGNNVNFDTQLGGINRQVSIDLSGLPPAKDPLSAMRDSTWQTVLSRSIKIAERDGRL